jgi:predicted phosphodiesterase
MVRIAALSDIHGNLWALEAVLADAKSLGVDLFVNLGDVLSGPLEPVGTAELLMSLGWPTIAGNHERQLLACAQGPGGPSDQFAFERTTAAQRAWLSALPATLEVAEGVFLCHGTPQDDRTYFLDEVAEGWLRLASAVRVEAHASGIDQGLLLCGHSHQPRVVGLGDGRLVVNPGSVGLQAFDDDRPGAHASETGSPHARYAICQRGPSGWTVELRAVAYEHRRAAAVARENGRADWSKWLELGRA